MSPFSVAIDTLKDGTLAPSDWLADHRKAAICFTIDDVHPGKSTDAYEAGGDLEAGALRHVEWLLEHHSALHVTLFITADWREIRPFPTRHRLSKIPLLRDRLYLTEILPKRTMRIDRHPNFVAYLKSLPRTDCALHGLHHVNTGPCVPEEYKGKTRRQCEVMLRETMSIFEVADLPFSPGLCPPAWGLSDELAEAVIETGLSFVASARDIRTPITVDATNSMSGRRGVSIIHPEHIMGGRLLHFSTNFQATSEIKRAHEIVGLNGLLAVKAHIVKHAFGFVQLDGLDEAYRDYLHRVFSELEDRYGNDLWWTFMAEIAAACTNGYTSNGIVR